MNVDGTGGSDCGSSSIVDAAEYIYAIHFYKENC